MKHTTTERNYVSEVDAKNLLIPLAVGSHVKDARPSLATPVQAAQLATLLRGKIRLNAESKDGGYFMPVKFLDETRPKRNSASVEFVHLLCVDQDQGEDWPAVQDRLERCGVAYVAYPTFNHNQQKGGEDARSRYRVLLFLDRPVHGGLFSVFAPFAMNAVVGAGNWDTGAKDAARAWYFPATRCDSLEVLDRVVGRKALSVDAILAGIAESAPYDETPTKRREYTPGGERPSELYSQSFDVEGLLGMLEAEGFLRHSSHGGLWYLTRPGKNPADGHSAVVGTGQYGPYVVNFSSGVQELPAEKRVGAFHVLQHFRCGGDFRRALDEAKKHLTQMGRWSEASSKSCGYALGTHLTGASASAEATAARYVMAGGKTYERLAGKNGESESLRLIAHFEAKIEEECNFTDGVSEERFFTIRVECGSRASFSIPVHGAKARSLGFIASLPAEARLEPGQTNDKKMYSAMVDLSLPIRERTAYGHTGWTEHEGEYLFLTSSGAIGKDGLRADIKTEANPVSGHDPMVDAYSLPEPPEGEALLRCIRASMAFLNAAPERITAPLLAGVYRAVFGAPRFAIWLGGTTGTRKTALAACAVAHFGAAFDHSKGLIQWVGTPYGILESLFTIKDCPAVVDDFVPRGNSSQRQTAEGQAQKVLRLVGNQAGRRRGRADGSVGPEKPPRCLLIATGEENPPGHSETARTFVVEIGKGDVRGGTGGGLTLAQKAGKDGLLSAAMAAFVRWLAPLMPVQVPEYLGSRTDGQSEELSWAVEQFARFAEESGLSQVECDQFLDRAKQGIVEAKVAQKRHLEQQNPADIALEVLQSLFHSLRAHVTAKDDSYPGEGWGWKQEGFIGDRKWVPQGTKIGYVLEGEHLGLIPSPAYAAIKEAAERAGSPINLNQIALWRDWLQAGYIVRGEKDRCQGKVTLPNGIKPRLIKLKISALSGYCRGDGDGFE